MGEYFKKMGFRALIRLVAGIVFVSISATLLVTAAVLSPFEFWSTTHGKLWLAGSSLGLFAIVFTLYSVLYPAYRLYRFVQRVRTWQYWLMEELPKLIQLIVATLKGHASTQETPPAVFTSTHAPDDHKPSDKKAA